MSQSYILRLTVVTQCVSIIGMDESLHKVALVEVMLGSISLYFNPLEMLPNEHCYGVGLCIP